MKELGDGDWVEVSEPLEVKSWEPSQKEGSVLFLRAGQDRYIKYVFENGRYNLVGEVTND